MITKVICSGCLLFAMLSSALVQTPGPRVELSLIVTDKANNSVNQLLKSDVRVFEDNVEQAILSLEPDQRPVALGIVIDASASFRSMLSASVEAAKLIIINKRPDDEIFIERFVSSDKIDTAQEFTSNRDELLGALKGWYVEGGQSAVVDALYIAVEHVAEYKKADPRRRRIVVIITDGEDRHSYYKTDALIRQLREQSVQVFVLGMVLKVEDYTTLTGRSPREKAVKLLKDIAEESGGRFFFYRDGKELNKATAQIVADLRGQFRLTYQSTNGDPKKSFRKVEVKLSSPDGDTRTAITRRGYQQSSSAQSSKEKSP